MKKAKSKKKSGKETKTLKPKMSATLKSELKNFLEYPYIKRLNRNLRKMMRMYLFYEKDGVPSDFEDFMSDLYFLYEFLDAVEDENLSPP